MLAATTGSYQPRLKSRSNWNRLTTPFSSRAEALISSRDCLASIHQRCRQVKLQETSKKCRQVETLPSSLDHLISTARKRLRCSWTKSHKEPLTTVRRASTTGCRRRGRPGEISSHWLAANFRGQDISTRRLKLSLLTLKKRSRRNLPSPNSGALSFLSKRWSQNSPTLWGLRGMLKETLLLEALAGKSTRAVLWAIKTITWTRDLNTRL
jgi:hypothetical protein